MDLRWAPISALLPALFLLSPWTIAVNAGTCETDYADVSTHGRADRYEKAVRTFSEFRPFALGKNDSSTRFLFSEPSLYALLGEFPEQTRSILNRWYGDPAKDLIDLVDSNLGQVYQCLLLDPGIANRATEFLHFSKEFLAQKGAVSPFALREAFSKHLGSEIVYRGLGLRPDQQDAILLVGMTSLQSDAKPSKQAEIIRRLLDVHSSPKQNIAFNPIDDAFDSPIGLVRQHIRGRSGGFFLSTSSFPEVAEYAAKTYSKEKSSQSKLFVFEISVPRLEVLELSGLFSPDALWGKGSPVRNPFGGPALGHDPTEILRTGTGFSIKLEDPRVEKLIPANIPALWIRKVRKL